MSAAADALMGIFGFKRVEGEMSKSVEDVRRAAFEAWYRIEFPALELRAQNLIGTYTKYHADLSWQAFNAALDAVEIQLPPEVAQFADDDRGRRAFSLFTNTAIRSCRAAIEQTGLGLRVK